MDDSRVIPFTVRTGRGAGDGQEPPGDDELIEAGNAYAVVRGTRTPVSLRFLLPGGKSFAMPYAFHPIIWHESPELILIEYTGFFTVILAGLRLDPLQARLCDHRVIWIRQCDPVDAASLPVAVTRIERMHHYPSRGPKASASDS